MIRQETNRGWDQGCLHDLGVGMGKEKSNGCWESRFAARSEEALFAGLGWVPGAWSEERDRVCGDS